MPFYSWITLLIYECDFQYCVWCPPVTATYFFRFIVYYVCNSFTKLYLMWTENQMQINRKQQATLCLTVTHFIIPDEVPSLRCKYVSLTYDDFQLLYILTCNNSHRCEVKLIINHQMLLLCIDGHLQVRPQKKIV